MMNMFKLLALPAALAIATPAVAQDFAGPRVETGVTLSDTNISDNNTQYNLGVGYDVAASDRVRLGVDATSNGLFTDNRELGLTGRLGYVVSPGFMVYGKAGYTNRELYNTNLDGFTYGAGAEAALTHNLYLKGEYRRTNFEQGVRGDAGTIGLGIRF